MRYIRPRIQQHKPGVMNKLELQYQHRLELLKRAGEIIHHRFEPIKFRLADNTSYKPDFMVTKNDRIEFHEVKGFMRDDANVKLKVVAELFQNLLSCSLHTKGRNGILNINNAIHELRGMK